ncbi:YybH family protein [Marinigracilibium pacificum]|uniref:Nuclear transport factor 2 family protein n=1 Tax=Marinigracilibium pacificum TaxID=2729599 RepID=A0A848IVY8_9BACT|nr:DUF4440 domain-containing protein [Marinigracilibium pacificum]NMM48497.1 nuclear transport factor 2 family protein [Marinigracilibium pacificum]
MTRLIMLLAGVLTMFSCQNSESTTVEDSTEMGKDEMRIEETAEDVKKIIDQKNNELEKLYLEGNMDEASKYFTDDVIQLTPNNKPIKGTQMYIDEWNKALGAGKWIFDFRVEDLKYYGDAAVELGSYDLKIEWVDNTMPPYEDTGHYMVLWERHDGEWKIVWDAPVSSLPLPGMEEGQEM